MLHLTNLSSVRISEQTIWRVALESHNAPPSIGSIELRLRGKFLGQLVRDRDDPGTIFFRAVTQRVRSPLISSGLPT